MSKVKTIKKKAPAGEQKPKNFCEQIRAEQKRRADGKEAK